MVGINFFDYPKTDKSLGQVFVDLKLIYDLEMCVKFQGILLCQTANIYFCLWRCKILINLLYWDFFYQLSGGAHLGKQIAMPLWLKMDDGMIKL